MTDLLYEIVQFLYNGATELIAIISAIPSFITQIRAYNIYLNPVNNVTITLLLTSIVSTYIIIKIRRLML